MRVRWTTEAADDLERICDDIAQNRPESAQRVAQSVVERIGTLKTFPHLDALVGSMALASSRFLHSRFLPL
jgi:plasmid stabilization system protein ParE